MSRALVIVVALLGACTERRELPGAPDAGGFSLELAPVDQLDVLFMMDNSAGMVGQPEFRRSLPALLAELSALPGGSPDLHAGVISSDLGAGAMPLGNGGCARVGGDRGVLQTRPSCGLPPGERFARAPRGAAASINDSLSCMLDLGVLGCGYEHQLAAVALALDPTATPDNAGFLRPDAHLAVVLFTDEDDCSAPPDTSFFAMELPDQSASTRCALGGHVCAGAHPPSAEFRAPLSSCRAAPDGPLLPLGALADRWRASKRDPDRQLTVVGVFASPAAHPQVDYEIARSSVGLTFASHCSSQLGDAAMALRLPAFVEAFGAAGTSFDFCRDDLGPTLSGIGRAIARRLTSACLPSPARNCQVTAGASLPACGDRIESACWRFEADPRCRGAATRLVIEGAGTLPAGTRISARCSD
jgi:hypothetical protein